MSKTPGEVISTHGIAQVEKNTTTGQNALIGLRDFDAGEVIQPFAAATTHSEPTYLTIQKADDVHFTLSPTFLQYVNHSCDPNAFFDTDNMQFVAVKPISRGDEFTFFYPSSEWHMAQPFKCFCGSPNCLGTISGADSIPEDKLAQYKLTGYIENKLRERKNATGARG